MCVTFGTNGPGLVCNHSIILGRTLQCTESRKRCLSCNGRVPVCIYRWEDACLCEISRPCSARLEAPHSRSKEREIRGCRLSHIEAYPRTPSCRFAHDFGIVASLASSRLRGSLEASSLGVRPRFRATHTARPAKQKLQTWRFIARQRLYKGAWQTF